MTKPVLYTFNLSIWSACADIARVELGLVDKIDVMTIDLVQAENLSPEFIKTSPNATLPAVTADGKVYGSTVEVIEYMIKTSSVKAAPRTPLTDAVHHASVDPNFAWFATRNDAEIAARVSGMQKGFLQARLPKIKEFADLPESAPYKALYDEKLAGTEGLLAIYEGKVPEDAKQKFFSTSKANYESSRTFLLETLPSAITSGPFVAGDVPGEDDFHVVAWLFHAALIAGATHANEGLSALEKHFGASIPDKVKVLYEAWLPRESFKATYPNDIVH